MLVPQDESEDSTPFPEPNEGEVVPRAFHGLTALGIEASLSPADDDRPAASSPGGLAPSMKSRTAPVHGSGPVSDNATNRELAPNAGQIGSQDNFRVADKPSIA